MRKYFAFILGIFFLVLFPHTSSAQGLTVQSMPAVDLPKANPGKIAPLVPPNPAGSILPFGQKQYYTVTLRGNGEAVVYLKTILSNKEDSPLSSIKIAFPQVPQDLAIYQVFREPQCVMYKTPVSASASIKEFTSQTQECAQYQGPDYEYGWGNTTYEKAQFTMDGTTAVIKLAKALDVNSSGSLVLAYTLPNVTHKNLFGAYNYTFETVKINETTQTLQVGILTDPDYYLKDTKGSINYLTKDSATAAVAAPLGSSVAMSSVQFDQFYNQIGQGTIVKTASSLSRNESYKVNGMYADSQMKLYAQELALGIFSVIIILIIGSIALVWSSKKLFSKKGKEDSESHTPAKGFSLVPTLVLSFGSSLFILLYTTALYGFSVYFGQIFQYYSYNNFIYPLVFLFLAVISLSFYSLFLFVPGIFIGIKRGLFSGITTVALTFFWLILYGIISAIIFFVFFQNTNSMPPEVSVQPTRVMMNSGSTSASEPAVNTTESAPDGPIKY